jgi:hypothetical protein
MQCSICVSVPLRGKYRGEYLAKKSGKDLLTGVSVPLRGKYRGEFFFHFSFHYYYYCFRPLAG